MRSPDLQVKIYTFPLFLRTCCAANEMASVSSVARILGNIDGDVPHYISAFHLESSLLPRGGCVGWVRHAHPPGVRIDRNECRIW